MKVNNNRYTIFLVFLFATIAIQGRAQSPGTVLVVGNANSAQSADLAAYYVNARSIPASNLLLVNWNADDNAYTCSLDDFTNLILQPILNKIAKLKHIDYIVLCRNLPIQVSGAARSIDSMIAGYKSLSALTTVRHNPYCAHSGPFNSSVYGIRLVTRLDGWSWNDARSLVDNSLAAVGGEPILLDMAPNCASGTYAYYNNRMGDAAETLMAKGANVLFDNTKVFCVPPYQLGGYYSWGSHDSAYSTSKFCALQFAPGALAETIYSFSGESIRHPGVGGSQSAYLIQSGVTGVKAYTSEPTAGAAADPVILFTQYLSGRNLAESFYSASAYIVWKDVVIGDPLCAPYK